MWWSVDATIQQTRVAAHGHKACPHLAASPLLGPRLALERSKPVSPSEVRREGSCHQPKDQNRRWRCSPTTDRFPLMLRQRSDVSRVSSHMVYGVCDVGGRLWQGC